jgi:hypothetical protein
MPHLGRIGAGVKIEMNAKKTVGPWESRREVGGIDWRKTGGRDDKATGEDGRCIHWGR